MDLDCNLSKLKTSIGSCNMHNKNHLEDASMHNSATESTTHISDAEYMMSEPVHIDYATILDDDSAKDEMLAAGTIFYRSNKNNATAKHLSKIWKIS